MARQFSFTKKERLLRPGDFSKVFKCGKKAHTKSFSVCVLKKGQSPAAVKRLGISVGSAVGNAVRRNRLKRLIREYFRLNKTRILPGAEADIVINVKKDAKTDSFKDVAEELDRVLTTG